MDEKQVVIPNYSPFLKIRGGETIYISGQLPVDEYSKIPISDNIQTQVKCALEKIEKILVSQGGSKKNIVKTVAYTNDMNLWDEINQAYKEFFGEYKPTRTIVAVKEIHFGAMVEIEGIAVI